MYRKQARKLAEPLVLLLLFGLVFGVYVAKLDTTTMTDTANTLHIALSAIKEGNVDLNEFPYAQGYDVKGHVISMFPVGTPLVVTPIVAVIDQALQLTRSFDLYEHLKRSDDPLLVARLNTIIASLLTALTALVVYVMGRLSLDRLRSALLALIFAFSTTAWSTASRDLWSHTPAMLMLALALYLILLGNTRPQVVPFASIPLAVAYVIRPTASIPIVLLTIYVGLTYRKQFVAYLLWALVIAVPFLLLNLSLFDTILPPYYRPGRLLHNPSLAEALAGNLISPSRGLLIYCPVLLLAFYGVLAKIRDRSFKRLDGFLLGILILHWLAVSSFKHWHAGASFGPRFLVDMLPYWMYFLIPVLDKLRAPATLGKWALGSALLLATLLGVFVNGRGATQRATWEWSMAYLNVVNSVDDEVSRVWDWSDPQFWRGLRPPRLAVAPDALCIAASQGDPSSPSFRLLLTNDGDGAFRWKADSPRRVFGEPAATLVPALGYAEPALTLDTQGLGPGVTSIGAILIEAVSEKTGRPVPGSPTVIPVSVQVAPATAQAPGDPPCYGLPDDILVDGQLQPVAPDSLHAVYGSGWYDRERAGDVIYRWTASPAKLLVHSPGRQTVELRSTPVAIHEPGAPAGMGTQGTLAVTVNGQAGASQALRVGQPFSFQASLEPGWNIVTLDLAAGNVRPIDLDPSTGDPRELSFALSPIDILLPPPSEGGAGGG